MENVFKYINSLIQPCLTDECADDEELAVRDKKEKQSLAVRDKKEKQSELQQDLSAPSKSCIWGGLFGATKVQAIQYQAQFGGTYAVIDFITDMMYFDSVLYVKISDNDSGDAMKAFLFITSIFGLFTSYVGSRIVAKNTELHLGNVNVQFAGLEIVQEYDPDNAICNIIRNFYVYSAYFRTWVEDTPQVIMTLVIDHYRIQQGQINRISNFGALSITFSLLSMLYINWKICVDSLELRGGGIFEVSKNTPISFRICSRICYMLYLSVFNFTPCIITACVLFA